MPCEHCDRERASRYSVAASVADTDATVTFRFCSRECLAAWSAGADDCEGFAVVGAAD